MDAEFPYTRLRARSGAAGVSAESPSLRGYDGEVPRPSAPPLAPGLVVLGLALLASGCGSGRSAEGSRREHPDPAVTPFVDEASRAELAPARQAGGGIELVLIPAGRFTMGADDGPPNERPPHEVELSRPFYMSRHPITQEQFARFVDATGYQTTAERDGGAKVWVGDGWRTDPSASWRTVFPGARRPVVAVTWNDATAFCDWLTRHEREAGRIEDGDRYRLPTEAQWEWAARAGTTDRHVGTDRESEVCRFGNVPDRAADAAGFGRAFVDCDDGVGVGTSEVGRYAPNPWGLHDMVGNVWEWVRDGHGPYSAEPLVDPEGPADAPLRTVRGGSWSGKLSGVRIAHRDGYPPDLRGGAVGFRVVLSG